MAEIGEIGEIVEIGSFICPFRWCKKPLIIGLVLVQVKLMLELPTGYVAISQPL